MRSTLQTVPESVPADHVTNSKVSRSKSDLLQVSPSTWKTVVLVVLCALHSHGERPRASTCPGNNEQLERNKRESLGREACQMHLSDQRKRRLKP